MPGWQIVAIAAALIFVCAASYVFTGRRFFVNQAEEDEKQKATNDIEFDNIQPPPPKIVKTPLALDSSRTPLAVQKLKQQEDSKITSIPKEEELAVPIEENYQSAA